MAVLLHSSLFCFPSCPCSCVPNTHPRVHLFHKSASSLFVCWAYLSRASLLEGGKSAFWCWWCSWHVIWIFLCFGGFHLRNVAFKHRWCDVMVYILQQKFILAENVQMSWTYVMFWCQVLKIRESGPLTRAVIQSEIHRKTDGYTDFDAGSVKRCQLNLRKGQTWSWLYEAE